MSAALVIGANLAGLTTAFRLRRSCWEVVVIDRSTEPCHRPVALTRPGLDAARRLGLPPGDVLQALQDKLDVRYGTWIRVRQPDRFGVTVTLSTGDVEWFDLVVDTEARFAGLNDSVTVYAAELFGDAFDIFHDFGAALSWWAEELRKVT